MHYGVTPTDPQNSLLSFFAYSISTRPHSKSEGELPLSVLNSLSATTKTSLREIGRRFGLDVRVNGINARDDLRLNFFLSEFKTRLILDVGANAGQFAQGVFENGYKGDIVSFEALPEAHEALLRTAAARREEWLVARRCAISDAAGTAHFHVTEADTASSLFAPLEELVASTPQIRLGRTIEVPTARLDDIVTEMRLNISECFLKLDVQGAEALVLAGAPIVLSAAKGIMTELMLTPLYDGQPSAWDVLEAIHAAGFEVWDVWQGYRNPHDQRLVAIDLICFKLGSA